MQRAARSQKLRLKLFCNRENSKLLRIVRDLTKYSYAKNQPAINIQNWKSLGWLYKNTKLNIATARKVNQIESGISWLTAIQLQNGW